MNFMFEWQEQYLTSEHSERVRYCSCHENIEFISSSSFYYINILMTAFLTIFRKFPPTFRRFPIFFQNRSDGQKNVSEHFPRFSEKLLKIAEDCRRHPKKTRRCFDDTPTNLKGHYHDVAHAQT